MTTYRLSPRAQQDIDDIWDYVAQDYLSAATRFTARLVKKFTLLAAQPHVGRSCDELGDGVLRFPMGHYVIFYRIVSERTEIIRILHGARDIEALFRAEEDGDW